MTLAILDQATVYAPLNTTIDGDRDYGGSDRKHFNPGEVSHLSGCIPGLDGCGCGGPRPQVQLGGCYENEQLTPGMLGQMEGGNAMLWVLGGLGVAWAWWAWRTPYSEVRRDR